MSTTIVFIYHKLQAFARRALSKINELNQLESMSNSPENPTVSVAFRQATIKVISFINLCKKIHAVTNEIIFISTYTCTNEIYLPTIHLFAFQMAIMVYKRTVFESRRKPKGLLRPKTRANLKDAAQVCFHPCIYFTFPM